MFIGLSEVSDRIIESFMWEVEGDLYGERFRTVLRWVVFYGVIVTWMLIGISVQYVRLVMINEQWSASNEVIQQIFSVEDNPLEKFIQINEVLNFRLDVLQQEHLKVVQEKTLLERDNTFLLSELNRIRLEGHCKIPDQFE